MDLTKIAQANNKLLIERAGKQGINPEELERTLNDINQRAREEAKRNRPKWQPQYPGGSTRVRQLAVASNNAPLETKHRNDLEFWLGKFITQDQDMLKLKDTVRRVAMETDAVLILGETGTGKEIIARALHGNRKGLFLGVNCGGFPEHLIESELFGHVKGAFTGAVEDKVGLFQAASEGTLFLDEIGELPLLMQIKLLRAIQEKSIRRVGSVQDVWTNCRIVAATNRDLDEMIVDNKFREELYWRLSVIELVLKPLRLRHNDIPMITDNLGLKLSIDDLLDKRISGNVRELQRIVRRKQLRLS